MQIRVAHLVNPTFGTVFSGHTHYLFSLLSGWKDEDVSLDMYGTEIKPLNLGSGDRNYQLTPGSFWSNPKRLNRWGRIRWSFELLYLLVKRRKEYDVAHFHNLNWGSLLSPLILHLFRKKVVFTMSLFGNDNPSYIRQQPRGRLQVGLLRRFDGAIGLSKTLVEDAIKHHIRNVINLPNYLAFPELEIESELKNVYDVRQSTRKKLRIPDSGIVLLFVGSIIHRKGVDVLIDTFVELSKDHKGLYLVLVGPKNKAETNGIDPNYIKMLEEKIYNENLIDRVFWIGMVKDQSAMVEYYRAADIFVFPTRNEGSPNVFVEAMAAKLPVIASFLKGITDEVVADGVSGYLVEPERWDLFAEAINKLLLDNDLRVEMGDAGRKIVLDKFGFDEYCRKLKEFYLGLVL